MQIVLIDAMMILLSPPPQNLSTQGKDNTDGFTNLVLTINPTLEMNFLKSSSLLIGTMGCELFCSVKCSTNDS